MLDAKQIPGLYPLDARSTPTPSCDNGECLRQCHISWGTGQEVTPGGEPLL